MRISLLTALASLALAGCLDIALSPFPVPARVAAQNARDATTKIVYLEHASGTFCGGVLVSRDRLLTAEHCFERRRDPVLASTPEPIAEQVPIGLVVARGSELSAQFARTSRDLALANLEAPVLRATRLPRLERPLLAGEIVEAWVPQVDGTGSVAVKRISCPVLGQSGPLIELDCVIHPGASGSPVFVDELGKTALAAILIARGQDEQEGIAVAAHIFAALPLFAKANATRK